MQILVIYDAQTKQIRRLAGPMPIPIEAHVGAGESGLVCDTTIPKSVADLQLEVNAHEGVTP